FLLTDQPPPVAVTAVDRAAVQRQQQAAIWIAGKDSGGGRVAVLAQRVDRMAWLDLQLARARDHLYAHRARGMVAIDQREVVRRDRDPEVSRCRFEAGLFLGREGEACRDVLLGRDPVAQLPAPVVE